MPRIARTLGLAFGLVGGVVASQGPEFAEQDLAAARRRPGSLATSLDHLVGARDERRWKHYPQGARGFEVDDQLELGGLLDGEV